jgi:lysophospholipase L1-like esterase
MPAFRRRDRGAIAVSAIVVLLTACGTAGSSTDPRSPTPSAVTTSGGREGLNLVAIGDSIPFNSPDDCPGCTGFVDQYAKAVTKVTGKPVAVQNLSQHTGLTLPQLVAELDSFKLTLAEADIILVGIAHNSFELNADAPCGRPLLGDAPDWSAVDAKCAAQSAAKHQPMYQTVYSRIRDWRTGKPTVMRTINRYNDWTDPTGAVASRAQDPKIKTMHDAWNTMLCQTATTSGFLCADIYHAFNGPDGTKPAADLLAGDYTHPSQAGNDLIARVLETQGFAPLA